MRQRMQIAVVDDDSSFLRAVARRLREEGMDVPLIFMTAHDAEESRQEGMEAGGAAYLWNRPCHMQKGGHEELKGGIGWIKDAG